jgi:hypothetical protein
MTMIRTLCLASAIAVAAAGAHAEVIPPYPPVAKGPLLSLAHPELMQADRAGRPALRPGPDASTARRGQDGGGASRRRGGGGVGVLCGIQPSADDSGVGTARGYNTEGRFVGAKLGFSF